MEATALAVLLPDIVIDLEFDDIDLSGMTADQIEKEFLIPAMEKAFEDLIADDPSLAKTLPPVPTQL